MAQWTDSSRTFLIQAVKKRDVLWIKERSNDSAIKLAKFEAFQEVLEELNVKFPSSKYTIDDVRSQWKNLKDTFVRKLRYISEGKYAYDTQKEPTWKFYRMLSFLDDKKKYSSMSPASLIYDLNGQDLDSSGLDIKTPDNGEHSNQSATSSEDQLMCFITNSYKQDKSDVNPPSPSAANHAPHDLPYVKHELGTKHSAPEMLPVDDDDESKKAKRPCIRRPSSANHIDECEAFGNLIATHLRRISEESSRATSLRIQKKISDLIFEHELSLLDRQ